MIDTKVHFSLLLPFFTSNPYIKMFPFLLSFKIYFSPELANTCFLKFCIIFVPFSFFYLFSDIIASINCLLLNWLTFILKVRFLSNSLPNYPLIISLFKTKSTLEKIHHCRVFWTVWLAPLYPCHYWKEFVKLDLSWSIFVDGLKLTKIVQSISACTYYRLYESPKAIKGSSSSYTPMDPHFF